MRGFATHDSLFRLRHTHTVPVPRLDCVYLHGNDVVERDLTSFFLIMLLVPWNKFVVPLNLVLSRRTGRVKINTTTTRYVLYQ